ncbi:MAG: hypothetical protein EPN37_09840 [Chitinophagaceae bacterium]|nr:MAG: hypothetical protein EPN37_09840 [Chitinophagaceae bacterium]
MKKKTNTPKPNPPQDPFPGYPEYPTDEDIFSKEKEESLSTGEVPENLKDTVKGPSQDDEMDVPGTELDDPDELIGEEDEENNYYSLGGDEHDDPDEEDEE